jgi:K+-transporting ATPase ATPase C chain
MPDKNNLQIHRPEASASGQPTHSKDGLLTHIRVSVIAILTTGILLCGVYPLIVWGISQALFNHKANGSLIKDKAGNVIASELLGQNFSAPGYFHPRPSANSYDPTTTGGTNRGPTSKKLINGTTKPTTLPATQPSGPPLDGPPQVDFPGVKLSVLRYADENSIPFTLVRQKREESGKITETPAVPTDFKTAKGDWDEVKLVNAFNDDVALTIRPRPPIPADAVTSSGSGLDPHISPANAQLQVARVEGIRKAKPGQVEKLVEQNTDGRDLGILGEPGVNVVKLNLALDQACPVPATQPTTAP